MLPVYRAGDTLLGWRWFRPRAGQVVVARHDRLLIKRIRRLEGRQVWVEGDNAAASTDSRQFGPVDQASLEAVIIRRL
jgi:phage repressor protein C with HTH and peptisase S24 domain